MNTRDKTEKKTAAILGTLCFLLIVYLGYRIVVPAAPTAARASAGESVTKARGHAGSGDNDDMTLYDPQVNLDTLKKFQSRPLPRLARNPFELPAAKVAPRPAPSAASGATNTGPPPIPLKALGYSEKAGGLREAMVVADDETIYVVHENETFAKRYTVLKITPTVIEVQDAETSQKVELPIPQ